MFYVYKIENKCNGKSYIGYSKNAKKRFKQHKSLLNKNKHQNSRLQNSWNKYGGDSFIFYIVFEYEASEDGYFYRKYIINCANNKPTFKTHKGFKWEWYNEEIE